MKLFRVVRDFCSFFAICFFGEARACCWREKSILIAGGALARVPWTSHCANFGKSESGIFAVKKDDRLIASNARSDLLGENHALTRNSSLNFLFSSFLHGIVRNRPLLVLRASVAKSFWCYLLSAQKVAEAIQTPREGFDSLLLLFDKSNQKQPR